MTNLFNHYFEQKYAPNHNLPQYANFRESSARVEVRYHYFYLKLILTLSIWFAKNFKLFKSLFHPFILHFPQKSWTFTKTHLNVFPSYPPQALLSFPNPLPLYHSKCIALSPHPTTVSSITHWIDQQFTLSPTILLLFLVSHLSISTPFPRKSYWIFLSWDISPFQRSLPAPR